MNLVAEVISVGVLYEIYFQDYFMLMTALVYTSCNVALVVLMLKSKKHVDNISDITVIESQVDQSMVSEPLIKKPGCWLEVRF